MEPRHLDALVAQARGWNINWSDPDLREGRIHWRDNESSTIYLPEQYQPSTNIAEAMALVEELRRGGNGKAACCIRLEITDYPVEKDCKCTIYGPDQVEVSADGHELPEAICLAYLKTKGVEVGE